MNPKIQQLIDTFSLLPDWEERYSHVIEMGKKMPLFPQKLKTTENKVQGCVSQVWLVQTSSDSGKKMQFIGDSDSIIVKGLVAILLLIYSDHTPEEILNTPMEKIFTELGLESHLTPIRRNGFYSMVQRIKALALTQSKQ